MQTMAAASDRKAHANPQYLEIPTIFKDVNLNALTSVQTFNKVQFGIITELNIIFNSHI